MEKSEIGRKSRKDGMQFEQRVRKDLEKKGWIVTKWSNNVEFDENNINLPPNERTARITPAKRKFNPFNKVLSIGTGFPDFVIFKGHMIFAVECKMRGKLDRIEKDKIDFLKAEDVFQNIVLASKDGRKIKYEDL